MNYKRRRCLKIFDRGRDLKYLDSRIDQEKRILIGSQEQRFSENPIDRFSTLADTDNTASMRANGHYWALRHVAPIGQQRTVDTVVKIGDNFCGDRPRRTVTDTALMTLKVPA